jgi:hypothetical protein
VPSHVHAVQVFEETPLAQIEDLAALRDAGRCVWIEVTGLADTAVLVEWLGKP